jgi:hypothetical protein
VFLAKSVETIEKKTVVISVHAEMRKRVRNEMKQKELDQRQRQRAARKPGKGLMAGAEAASSCYMVARLLIFVKLYYYLRIIRTALQLADSRRGTKC